MLRSFPGAEIIKFNLDKTTARRLIRFPQFKITKRRSRIELGDTRGRICDAAAATSDLDKGNNNESRGRRDPLPSPQERRSQVNLDNNIRWADAYVLMYAINDKCSFDKCHHLKFLIDYNRRRKWCIPHHGAHVSLSCVSVSVPAFPFPISPARHNVRAHTRRGRSLT